MGVTMRSQCLMYLSCIFVYNHVRVFHMVVNIVCHMLNSLHALLIIAQAAATRIFKMVN